jgi:thiol-disulfide isomerase/thioredoxin
MWTVAAPHFHEETTMYKCRIRSTKLHCLFAVVAMVLNVAASASTRVGAAPDFTLKSRSGENIKLSELKGEVVMVNFWASWCGPCREEMPKLEQMYKRYQSRGLTVIGVNVEQDARVAERMLNDIPVSFPILFDPHNKVGELYGINVMPSTFLLDRDGTVRYLHRGYQPGYEADYQRQIRELIREPAAREL